MTDETIENIADFELPFGRLANLKSVTYESGLDMLRVTLRENRRFTIVDLDPASAGDVGKALTDWAKTRKP